MNRFEVQQLNDDPLFIQKEMNNICASVQSTIIETLIRKLIKASEDTGIKEIAIAGGVSANSGLRNRFLQESASRGWKAYIPDFEYCRDKEHEQ